MDTQVPGGERRQTSATRGSMQDEIADVSRWANHHLSLAGYNDQLITDLAVDMADGITLLRIVKAISNEPLPKHFPNPLMRVQKLENFQLCLRLLQQKGVVITFHAEDIVNGNTKSILAVCHALRRHFTEPSSPKSRVTMSTTSHAYPPSAPMEQRPSLSQSGRLWSTKSLDREDMALLSWLGEVVHRDIPDYTMLHDGKILCELMNKAHDGAVSEQDITLKSPEERLHLALSAGETYLFIPSGSIDITKIASGTEDGKLKNYLIQVMPMYKQIASRRQLHSMHRHREENGFGRAGEGLKKPLSRRRTPSQEDISESLRSSGMSGSLEQREAARIASRSYDGLKQKKMNGEEGGRKVSRHPPGRSHSSASTISSISSTPTNQPPPQLTDKPPPSIPSLKASFHSSHQHLSTSRHQQPHSSSQPLSHIYVTGASSYSDLSTSRGDHATLVEPKAMTKQLSAERLGVQEGEGGVAGGGGGELRNMTTRGLHRSMDSGIASGRKPPPRSSALGASWGGSASRFGYESEGTTASSRKKSSNGISSLPRPGSTSALSSLASSAPPTSMTLSHSLTRSSERVNQPTFEPFGGRMAPRRSGSYSRLDSATIDELSVQVADLHERVTVLSMQCIYERAELFKQLQRAVAKERRRRQAVESRLKHVEKVAEQLMSHYDGCFVELAKDVSYLKAAMLEGDGKGKERMSSGRRLPDTYVSREIQSIKQQLSVLMQQQESVQLPTPPSKAFQNLSLRSANVRKGHQKHPLFLRKRSNSDSIPPHGPFLRGPTARLKKLSNFFGEEPPYLQDLQSFLDGLGYSYLLPKFVAHQITLAELRHLDDSHLEKLGIPLGPRARILSEVKELLPLDNVSDVI